MLILPAQLLASAGLGLTILLVARDLRATVMVHDLNPGEFQFLGLEGYHAEWSGARHNLLE